MSPGGPDWKYRLGRDYTHNSKIEPAVPYIRLNGLGFTFRIANGLSLALIGNDAAEDGGGAAVRVMPRHFR